MFRLFATAFVLFSLFALNGCDDVPDLSLPNEPPVARDDSISLKQNETTTIPVRVNDTDIDGDDLVITSTTNPAHGVIENLSVSIRYTPDLYYIGSDTFTYEVTDLVGHTATATVSIEVTKRHTRAIFSTDSATGKKLHLLDSRDAGTLIDLSQSLDAGEMVLNWAISEQLELAVLLTDLDRIVTVSFDDPTTTANIFEIDTTNGPVDGGLAVSAGGNRAVYTLDHRYVVYIDLNNVLPLIEYDTGFDTGTMRPSFLAPLVAPVTADTLLIMEGTLGEGADEHSAIYSVPLSSQTPVAILDDATILQSTLTRPLSASSAMVWLTDSAAMSPAPAAYSCMTPPPQTLSALSYTLLGAPSAGTNLNMASSLLTDPTTLISYNNGRLSNRVLVAACPPNTDIVQIIEIPFATPASARVLATADDPADGLWNIDVASASQAAIYTLDGPSGLRTRIIDLTADNPESIELTVPDFQTYTVNTELRLPPSVFSTDGLRWLFLAPENDALSKLQWLQVATMQLSSVDLPFTATNLVSDGFYAVVQGETGSTDPAPLALVDLGNSEITTINLDGILVETVTDPLNQIEAAISLYLVP